MMEILRRAWLIREIVSTASSCLHDGLVPFIRISEQQIGHADNFNQFMNELWDGDKQDRYKAV